MAYCSACGSEVADAARFCSTCGTTLGSQNITPQAAQPQSPSMQPSTPQNPNKGCGQAFGVGCGILILIALILFFVGVFANMREGTHSTVPLRQARPLHHAAAPAPKPRVLIDVEGSGIKTTQRFDTPNEWAIAWTFDCSDFGQSGNFVINVNGDVDDLAANQLATRGHDVTYEHSGGNVYLQINSECAWHVRAVGQ